MSRPSALPTARLFADLVRFLVIAAVLVAPREIRAEPRDFDLLAQPAAAALLEFSKQAGIEVLFSFDGLRNAMSTAVMGRLEPDDALARLLQGTGFTAHRNWRGKFVVAAERAAGSIRGILLKPTGDPAPGLHVALPSTRQKTVTDDDGVFFFPGLIPGTYRLVVTGPGIRSLEITDARVVGNQTLTLAPQTLQSGDNMVRLDPFVVEARSSPGQRGSTLPVTRIAAGNLDLPRSENDALPFQVFDRDQILRTGEINLNEFLQRELLDSDASRVPPERDPNPDSNPTKFVAGSTNLNLRDFGSDETVVLVNGRRLPEILTSTGFSQQPPDVNLIPLGLVQRVEVLPIAASSLYTGNPVGGVINVILRKNVTDTEVTATYSNAVRGFNAPQSSLSLQHGQSLLDGKLQILFNATFTEVTPPTESQLNYHHGQIAVPTSFDAPIYGATPNIRSAAGTPLFGPGTATVTSVATGADGTGGLAAFSGREGVTNLALFDPREGMTASIDSADNPYGRRQKRSAYFGSAVYDVLSWLQLGLDGFYSRIVANRGFDVFNADLTLDAGSPLNPFGQDVRVALNETAPHLGENYSEAKIESYAIVAGLLLKLPSDWRVAFDAQFASNITKYRGLAAPDQDRWQQLVDEGIYNPLRDTQAHGPPQEFYDQVLVYYGGKDRFVTLGNYETLDTAVRVTNQSLRLPTGPASTNLGADFRVVRLADYSQRLRFADGSDEVPPQDFSGRILKRYSVFGELQAPLYPANKLPPWLKKIESDIALRYVASASAAESNFAPTFAVKLEFAGGLSFRGSVTTASRFPTPQLSSLTSTGSAGGSEPASVTDPRRGGEGYSIETSSPLNPSLHTEDAITQTAGFIFQRGQNRHFRASLDFVDTHKTNELLDLDHPQDVVDLESYFPDRVVRAAPEPGETVGKITTVYTGDVNAASRHSQDWSLSVDYSWDKFLGGTLDLYGRLVYFPRYNLQLLPHSPSVDELRHPDLNVPGILKYRSNFGASWTNKKLGGGIEGRYFHSRILPQSDWLLQGSDHIEPYLDFDAYLQSDLSRWLLGKNARYGLRGQVRVNNIFGASFPRSVDDPSGAGVQPYGDWRGRTYSLSLTATF